MLLPEVLHNHISHLVTVTGVGRMLPGAVCMRTEVKSLSEGPVGSRTPKVGADCRASCRTGNARPGQFVIKRSETCAYVEVSYCNT